MGSAMVARSTVWTSVLCVMVLAAGCASPEPEASTSMTPADDPSMSVGEASSPATAPEPTVRTATFYLTKEGGLSESQPEDGAVPAAGSYREYFAGNFKFNQFSGKGNRTRLVLPVDAEMTFFVRADQPVPTAHTNMDYAVWFGTDRTMPLGMIVADNVDLMAGQTVEVSVPLKFDGQQGIWWPKGEDLQVFWISGQVHEGTGNLKLLVGGEHASRVEMTLKEFPDEPLADASGGKEEHFTGTLTQTGAGSACGATAADDGTAADSVTIAVPTDAKSLWVKLAAAQSAPGTMDVDVFLLDGTTLVTNSHTPRVTESVYLANETLAPFLGKELRYLVSACSATQAAFDATIIVS